MHTPNTHLIARQRRGAVPRLLGAAFCALASATLVFASSVQSDVDALLDDGRFANARNLITRHLANAVPADRADLEFELARIDRIAHDYPLTAQALFGALQRKVRGVTWNEFQGWVREGRFDTRIIDGEQRFMVSSVSNLFFRYPELEARRIGGPKRAAYERRLVQTCTAIRSAARTEGTPYVLPRRFEVQMSVVIAPEAAPAGATTRVWLPVPRSFPHQGRFELLDASSPVRHLAGDSSPIRSVLLEQTARRHKKNVFDIRYAYTASGVSFDLDATRVSRDLPEHAQPYLGEAPHVVFTPELKALAQQLAAGESNPMTVARSYYDWISTHIKYSFATEYSTIRNISDYCLQKQYGDCGQQALLFIALCRASGIPARWQSGWSTFPGAQTMHDWAEIYLAPYGWVPVDPYMGVFATQYARTLSAAERKFVRDFYFGGLDQHRIAVNKGHSQELQPPKRSPRSDTVDFQRGEAEYILVDQSTAALDSPGSATTTAAHNIYFDRYTFALTVKSIN